MINTVSLQ